MENAVLDEVVVESEPTVLECDVYGDEKLKLIEERISKLNKRASIKGFPLCVLTSVFLYIGHKLTCGSVVKDKHKHPKRKWTGLVVNVYHVVLTFPKLAIGEYELLGALRPLELKSGGRENLLNNVPGKEIPAEYAKSVGICDYCNKARHRSETFVVRHMETGETKSVGRQCIKDFLGHDPSGMIWVYEQISELSDEDAMDREYGAMNTHFSWDLECILALTFKCIAVDGWVSGKMAESGNLTATSDIVGRISGNFKPFDWSESRWEEYKSERHYGDKELERAAEAIAWAQLKNESGYERNINLLARVGMVSEKELGLAASIAASFLRATTDEAIYKNKERSVEIDEYYGTEGERVTIDVIVVRVIPCETAYGTSGMHIMRTLEGHSLKWFSSASEWLAEGDRCRIKATIKKHDIFKDKKQTSLSRVKLIEVLSENKSEEAA